MAKSKLKLPEPPKALPKLPFSMRDRSAFIDRPWIACEAIGKDYVASIFFRFSTGGVEACAVPVEEVDRGHGSHSGRRQFYTDGEHTGFGPTGLAKTHLQWLKNKALQGGATPDAIRLLKKVTDVTAKDEKEMSMAEKAAKAKKVPTKASKAAKSDDAAPVGGGGKVAGTKAKGKGNAEALAKARAARAENAGPDTRKIKLVNKENPYRDGSNRASSFNALKGAKTVEDYKSAGGKTKYLSRWAEENRITLG